MKGVYQIRFGASWSDGDEVLDVGLEGVQDRQTNKEVWNGNQHDSFAELGSGWDGGVWHGLCSLLAFGSIYVLCLA